MLQSPHGVQGNFEVLIPRPGGGMWHFWRDNDRPPFPWTSPILAYGSTFDVSAAALIFSSYGHLELVATEGDSLVHHWRDDGGSLRWQGLTYLPGATGIVGSPGLTQSSFGSTGNFEVVAPVAGGGLTHWWRDNDHDFSWHQDERFGGPDLFQAATVIQSNFGTPGHLEVVARSGDRLVHFWSAQPGTWNGPTLVATGVSGSPSFIQSSYGSQGNFEVVTPMAAGGLAHFWRDNDQAALPWGLGAGFGSGTVVAAGLVQGNFGPSGNLEVVAWLGDKPGDELIHHWRDGAAGAWSPSTLVYSKPVVQPQVSGESQVMYSTGTVAIHAHLMRTGKLLAFGFTDTDDTMGETRVLDLSNAHLSAPPATPNLFCSGHQFLPDGRLLVAGGHHMDIAGIHTFDPLQETWTERGSMPRGRWYPTCTALEDGRVFVISGTANGGPVVPGNPVNNTVQVFDPGSGGMGPEQAIPSPFAPNDPTGFATVDLYPFCFLLPGTGRVLVHSRRWTRFYDPASGSWDSTILEAAYGYSRTYPAEGSAVMLPLRPGQGYRARVMAIGGAGAVTDPFQLKEGIPATNTAEILDLGAPQPAWRFTAPMQFERVMPDAVLLPDGTVLVVGGSSTGRADMGSDPVLPVELFDPAGETWTTLAPKQVPASYHSVALLLPDATVLMAGKDGIFNAVPYSYPEHRGEVFRPPYIFRGPRPVITGSPPAIGYGQGFAVGTPDAATIASAVLIRCSSVTHSFNMGQRLVELEITSWGPDTVTLQAPPNGRVAPPGHHLLFILSAAGVPSVAPIVRLG